MEALSSPAGQTQAQLLPDNKTRSQRFSEGEEGCPRRRDGREISNSTSNIIEGGSGNDG